MDHAAPSGKHSSLEFSRSAAPFADALVPRLQRSASEAVKLPPTTNELSREERRHFVKRSKKVKLTKNVKTKWLTALDSSKTCSAQH